MEEISLKELILILLREIKLVVVITVVCIAVGFAFAYTRPKVYEATLTLMTSPISQSNGVDTSNVDTIVDSANNIFPFPNMDVTTYKEQFLNPEVLMYTIEELNLTNADGTPMGRDTLQSMVTVEIPEQTSLLTVTVKNADPELASSIANTMGDKFSDFITEKSRMSVDSVSATVNANLEVEKAKLDEEAQRRRDYLMESDSIDLMNSEIGVLVSQITDYKASLNTLERDIAVYKNSLAVILNGGETVTALDLEALDLSISGGNQGSYSVQINEDNQLQSSLLTIEATNLETSLVRAIEQQKVISTEVVKLEARLVELQARLAQEQYIYDSLNRDYALAESTYAAYQTKAKEIMIAAVADIGRTSIQVSSEAVPPIRPAGTSKAIILLVAAFGGGMIGIFAAFFKSYWASDSAFISTSKDVSV